MGHFGGYARRRWRYFEREYKASVSVSVNKNMLEVDDATKKRSDGGGRKHTVLDKLSQGKSFLDFGFVTEVSVF